MVAIKPLEQSSATWETRSINASDDYVRGTDAPRRPWAESALAAEANYKTSVIAAANAGRFGGGVRKAGNQQWKAGIDRKGKANYQTGVSGAAPNWAKGYAPSQAVIQSTTLGPRGAKNSPGNYQRSQMIGQNLHAAKMRTSGQS